MSNSLLKYFKPTSKGSSNHNKEANDLNVNTTKQNGQVVIDDQQPCCSLSLKSNEEETQSVDTADGNAGPNINTALHSLKINDSSLSDEAALSTTTSISPNSVISESSLKENVLPKQKKSNSNSVYKKNPIMQAYAKKKRRHSSGASKKDTPRGRKARRNSFSSESKNVEEIPMKKRKEVNGDDEGSEDDVYIVEKVVDKNIVEGIAYYFIKWKGWGENSNTWEPIEHLDGCSEAVEEFERNLAQANKSSKANRLKIRPSGTKKSGSKKRSSSTKLSDNESDADEDDDTFNTKMKSCQSFVQNHGIHQEWPKDKEPVAMEGVIFVGNTLVYIIRRKTRIELNTLERTNTIMVHADSFRLLYPEIVIKYYEKRLLWGQGETEEDAERQLDMAAANSMLLRSTPSSEVGGQIMKAIDNEVKENHPDIVDMLEAPITEEVLLDTPPATKETLLDTPPRTEETVLHAPSTNEEAVLDPETQQQPVLGQVEEAETQVIENQDVNMDGNDGLKDDESKGEQGNDNETNHIDIISKEAATLPDELLGDNNKNEKLDKFGLPLNYLTEDEDEVDTSVSSAPDSSAEEELMIN